MLTGSIDLVIAPESQDVQEYLDRGELVPDQVVLDMVREALIAAKAAGGGYVMDGIPRNMQQARATYLIARELGMTADVALHLQAWGTRSAPPAPPPAHPAEPSGRPPVPASAGMAVAGYQKRQDLLSAAGNR